VVAKRWQNSDVAREADVRRGVVLPIFLL